MKRLNIDGLGDEDDLLLDQVEGLVPSGLSINGYLREGLEREPGDVEDVEGRHARWSSEDGLV